MASDFPATVTAQVEHGSEVLEFLVSVTAGEVAAGTGELMYYDTATGTIKRCGADPSLIAGIFESGASAAARLLTPDNRVPLRCIKPNALVRMCSATTPVAATHEGVVYGIARLTSGNWAVDTTDTSNTRVVVKRVNPVTGEWFVSFLAASLQFDAVVS